MAKWYYKMGIEIILGTILCDFLYSYTFMPIIVTTINKRLSNHILFSSEQNKKCVGFSIYLMYIPTSYTI